VANSASSKDGVEDIRVLAVVEPEGKFIQIQRQIFLAHVVVGAYNAALQETPKAFDVVRVNLTPNIFPCAVLGRRMGNVAVQIVVGLILVRRNERHFVVNDVADETRKRASILSADHTADHVALASDSADDSSFAVAYSLAERLLSSHFALLPTLFVPVD
jgi:hypothetical protein